MAPTPLSAVANLFHLILWPTSHCFPCLSFCGLESRVRLQVSRCSVYLLHYAMASRLTQGCQRIASSSSYRHARNKLRPLPVRFSPVPSFPTISPSSSATKCLTTGKKGVVAENNPKVDAWGEKDVRYSSLVV